jgi:hypothetical protein
LQAKWATAGQALSGCSPSSSGALAPDTTKEVALAGNTIPAGVLDPNAQLLLKAGIFPAPTSGNSFIGGNKEPTSGKEEIVRIDHQFTDKFSIFGHFIADQSLQTYGETQWSGDNVPTVFNTYGNPSYSFVVHATESIRPNLLNEIGFGYDGNRIHILPQGVYQQPSGFNVPQVFTNAVNVDNRIPDIHLAGSTGSFFQSRSTGCPGTTPRTTIRSAMTSPGPEERTSSSLEVAGPSTRSRRTTSRKLKAASDLTASTPGTTLRTF